MNTKIISSNISEALEELSNINNQVLAKSLGEVEFQIKLQHVYHHLNFAWNVRHIITEQYRNMTDKEFIEWGQYPQDIDFE